MRVARAQLRFVSLLLIAWGLQVSGARAEQWSRLPDGEWVAVEQTRPPAQLFDSDGKVRLFGLTLLAGLPDGIAPGISVHPGTNLLHIDVAMTGLFSLGVRGGVTLDPFDWVVAPTLTVAGGYSGWADLPTSTTAQYQLVYVNIQPGIEIGRRSRFRVFLRAGYSHFWVAGTSAATYDGLSAASEPKLRINFLPSVNLGLTSYFGP